MTMRVRSPSVMPPVLWSMKPPTTFVCWKSGWFA
jgi:hypothetical protein